MDTERGLTTTIRVEEDGCMLKEIIYGRLGLSRGLLRRMKSGGAVYLNQELAYITQRGAQGDILRIDFADSASQVPPERLPLDIVYEDTGLLVVNKPAGMPVHPTRTYSTGTLANAIAYLWEARGYRRRIRLLHRLDRETSGLLVIAKEPYAYQRLSLQLQNHTLERSYLAIVEGHYPHEEGFIDQPIGRHPSLQGHSLRRAVVADGKRALTYYQVVQRYQNCTLLRLQLKTGRTHQIRVHMAWQGYPLIGDVMYGGQVPFARQALHAFSVAFDQPRTGERISIRTSLPEDMLMYLKERKIV